MPSVPQVAARKVAPVPVKARSGVDAVPGVGDITRRYPRRVYHDYYERANGKNVELQSKRTPEAPAKAVKARAPGSIKKRKTTKNLQARKPKKGRRSVKARKNKNLKRSKKLKARKNKVAKRKTNKLAKKGLTLAQLVLAWIIKQHAILLPIHGSVSLCPPGHVLSAHCPIECHRLAQKASPKG